MTHLQTTMRIIVDVDPALAGDMSPELQRRLARGLRVRTCYRGVRIDGLPCPYGHHTPIFTSSREAVRYLHELSDVEAEFAQRTGGADTAIGRWMLDRAAFLRCAAECLIDHRLLLWPDEVDMLAVYAHGADCGISARQHSRNYRRLSLALRRAGQLLQACAGATDKLSGSLRQQTSHLATVHK